MSSPLKTSHSKESFLERVLRSPQFFAGVTVLLGALWTWPKWWALSGAPVLYLCILHGEAEGYRVLAFLNLWLIFTSLNLTYAICSTSWLLYWVFSVTTYGAIGLVALIQFPAVGRFARKRLRALLKSLYFIDDKIAFFDLPALEIDTEVDGLFVIRGITFSLSTLSFKVHGVEVGVKLSDDMELAIQAEEVEVKLLRGVWVGDCFANLKGGKYEMTFGELGTKSKDAQDDAIFVEGSQLVKAATFRSDTRTFDESTEKMTSAMTGGNAPEATSPKNALSSAETLSPDNNDGASSRYYERLSFIQSTNAAEEARVHVTTINRQSSDLERTFQNKDSNAVRAAICSELHRRPSVPHPPQKSITVTRLQNLSSPRTRTFLHRLPMLLRLLLNPLSYFHPVHISAITATASGAWIDSMLTQQVFQSYHTTDSQLATLKRRISAWLSNANFVVELAGITGNAHVPFIPTYDIRCHLNFEDFMAYRSVPEQVNLKQVVRLAGADATFVLPSFLLPHHEHLVPPVPTRDDHKELEDSVTEADGKPKRVLAEHDLKQAKRDETNAKISAHARLPACFDQELLDFVAALVKVTKVVEMEKAGESSSDDEDEPEPTKRKLGEVLADVNRSMKGGLKRKVVDGIINDRWIAKMVGKVTKRLETAKGEAGYSGDIPIPLGPYRTGLLEVEGEKLLP